MFCQAPDRSCKIVMIRSYVVCMAARPRISKFLWQICPPSRLVHHPLCHPAKNYPFGLVKGSEHRSPQPTQSGTEPAENALFSTINHICCFLVYCVKGPLVWTRFVSSRGYGVFVDQSDHSHEDTPPNCCCQRHFPRNAIKLMNMSLELFTYIWRPFDLSSFWRIFWVIVPHTCPGSPP